MEDKSNPSYIYNLNHLPKWNTENEKMDKKQETITIKKTWSRLHKMEKIEKLRSYVDIYGESETLSESEKADLFTFLKHSLDRKRLQNAKDIVYNTETAAIEKIPNLKVVEDVKRRFTLKKSDQCMKISKTILSRSKTMKKSLKKNNISTLIEADGN